MKADKIREAISRYRQDFERLGIQKIDYPHDQLVDSSCSTLGHCYGMLDKIEQFIQQGRMDKVFRWYGFVQGVLWVQKVYPLVALKEHSRPDPDVVEGK